MKEILITSSALILALLALRRVFRKTLSRRVQYALWTLVLARLLVPVSLPAADFSVLTAAQPVEQAVTARLDRITASPARPGNIQTSQIPSDLPLILDHVEPEGPLPQIQIVEGGTIPSLKPAPAMTAGEILALVWKAGMVAMGAFFLVSNLRFYGKLRKNRRRVDEDVRGVYAELLRGHGGLALRRKVYLVDEDVLPSPCLFCRSIYLTPAALQTEDSLRHVLCHEETHARHLDPVWSLLRCVCLTVYWFDPLVWMAAACSKADCELACDESVLKALGERERVPYGQTLLALIPVKKGPANPMLSATTMTAGKRQLRDRITRIAQRPRQLLAAVVAVAVLAGIAAACTFTGGETPSPTGPEDTALRALTGEELRWFNEQFFNRNLNPAISYTYSIRNQFANPINLYDRPEDIDLYELLYLEGSAPTREEIRQILEWDPDDLPCAAYKITTREVNDILTQHTGLTLDQANRESLTYTYDEATDAYYWAHGDTNYPSDLDFLCGTREGATVRLYHSSRYAGISWYCVTLEEQPDGGYWFVSNQTCDAPRIPTPLPSWEPVATISLGDLEPCATVPVPVTAAPQLADTEKLDGMQVDDRHVVHLCRTGENTAVAAYRDMNDHENFVEFLPSLTPEARLDFYGGLLGRDGFYVEYQGQYDAHSYGPVRDYYYFDGDGTLKLLARCETHAGECYQLDLNGDGTAELAAPRQLFFLRDGVVYEARLDQLLLDACPQLSYWDSSGWDKYSKRLSANGLAHGQGPQDYGYDWTRYLYFDGESILVYKSESTTTDHMVDGIANGVPNLVVDKAREAALLGLVEVDGFYRRSNYQEHEADGVVEQFDDWRIGSFYGPTVITLGSVTVEAWSFVSEVHAVEPGNIVIAGGNYLTEDGWTWNYTADNTVFLRREDDGSLTYLWTGYDDGTLDSHIGREALARAMEEHGVPLAQGYTYAALQAQSDLALVLDHSGGWIQLHLTTPLGGGGYNIDPAGEDAAYYRARFADPDWFQWSALTAAPTQTPTGTSLIIASSNWYQTLQFWEGSDLVMSKASNRPPVWYRAEPVSLLPDDVFYERSRIFNVMREWFDQLELADKRLGGPVLEYVEGESYRELAHRWAAAYEMPRMNLTSGSSMGRCLYVKVTEEEVLEDMPETWFPPEVLDYPHFAFSYTTAFVPESETALAYLMAGNTGEYEGNDPDVPEGAFEYSRMGSLYLKDGYWYCGGVGTG